MKQSKIFEVYEEKNRLYTKSLAPGIKVYGERLIKKEGDEYREWDAKRSKLAAFIKKGAKNIFIRKGHIVMYLGAASGTTVSHISDIVGKEGLIFAVEFSPRTLRDLVFVAEQRKNIAPILADAGKPREFASRVCAADVVYQDIAQPNQAEIFVENCRMFSPGGYGILALKARSVDISKKPKVIFKETRRYLEKHMVVVDYRELDPFEKDHAMFVCKVRQPG